MFDIHSGDIVAAALAAAGACLACSIPGDFVRRFPLWAVQTYGRRALLMPFLAMMIGTWLFRLGVAGQINTPPGQALVLAAAFLGTVLVSALLRFYLKEYRKR
ncbi:hypothetical protein [Cupriavidus sp. TMH.W2]|uniref:hypothetical protein n=1 Tax=Cupriavidus sp. TMH.W2 TaxID=3434465 RepID=UPI003D779395